MKLHVIIPFCERDTYLEETLFSVRKALENTREGDVAVTVFDNASSHDRAKSIVENLGDSRFQYVKFADRLPIFENWNRCVEHAATDWFHLLHDDDLLDPAFYSQFFDYLNREESFDLYATSYLMADANCRPVGLRTHPWPDGQVMPLPIDQCLITNPVAPSAGIMKRSHVLEQGGFPTHMKFAGDWYLYAKLAATGKWIASLRPLMWYRVHNDSVTKTGASLEEILDENRQCADLAAKLQSEVTGKAASPDYSWAAFVYGEHLKRCLRQKEFRSWWSAVRKSTNDKAGFLGKSGIKKILVSCLVLIPFVGERL